MCIRAFDFNSGCPVINSYIIGRRTSGGTKKGEKRLHTWCNLRNCSEDTIKIKTICVYIPYILIGVVVTAAMMVALEEQ